MKSAIFKYEYRMEPEKIMRVTRRLLDMSQKDVAHYLGTTQWSISRMERGEKSIGAVFWYFFCQLVGADCDIASYGFCERFYLRALKYKMENGRWYLPVSQRALNKIILSTERIQEERDFEARFVSQIQDAF